MYLFEENQTHISVEDHDLDKRWISLELIKMINFLFSHKNHKRVKLLFSQQKINKQFS